jgi:RNA polymerase sigma-70 factor (ECF subfamily)
MRNELAPLLRRAMATLPRRESVVFSLRHLNDLSYEQIAGQLGITAGSVGVILHRARKHLRAALHPLLTPAGASPQGRVAAAGGESP